VGQGVYVAAIEALGEKTMAVLYKAHWEEEEEEEEEGGGEREEQFEEATLATMNISWANAMQPRLSRRPLS
jgi:hypothetical protein